MSDPIDTFILQAVADARAAARDRLPYVDQAILACGASGVAIDRYAGRAASEGTIFDGPFLYQLTALGDALETVVEAGTHRTVEYVECGLNDDSFFPVACRSPQTEHAADLRFRLRRSSDTIHRAEDLIAARRMLEGRR